MSRGPVTFRARDVTAAVKAVTAAGYVVVRVEVDKAGRIVVVTNQEIAGEPPEPVDATTEWDNAL
jgi:hypothetical protein